ncbi:MAG TPA: hypothetical protein VLK34_10225 [Nocardioidaceae bacterium]|nr:hypothetical protein [Nocardioidaceae bacterium]
MADDDMVDAALSGPVGAIVIRESNTQRNFLYGFLTVAIAVALVRGALSHPDGFTLVVMALLTVVFALVLAAWWLTWRDPYRVEVSVERVRYLGRKTLGYPDLVRDRGIDLWLYARPAGRSEVLVLEQPASGQEWTLRFVGRQPLVDACTARGWTIVSTRRRPS